MSNQVQLYTPETKAVALRRFGRDLQTLNQAAEEKLYILMDQGFNAYTDLAIYEHQPYVTIDGWFNAVKRSGRRVSRMPTMPVPREDRDLWGLEDHQFGFICEIYLEGDEKPFATGFGTASREQPHRGRQPVEVAHPGRQAMKRAQAHALRQALQAIGMLPQVNVETYDKEVGVVDGEVVEGTVTVLEDNDTPPEAPRTAPAPRTPQKAENTPQAPRTAPVAQAAQAMDGADNEAPKAKRKAPTTPPDFVDFADRRSATPEDMAAIKATMAEREVAAEAGPPDSGEQPSMLGGDQPELATDKQWKTLRALYRHPGGNGAKSRQELMVLLYQTAPGEFTPPHTSLTENQADDFIAAAQG